MPPPTKRRRLDPRKHALEEVTFDPTARADYLTGFHKRKQQRIKAAQDIALRKAKEQAIADRRAMREQRKADLESHVRQVNEMLRAAEEGEGLGGSEGGNERDEVEEEWSGVEDGAAGEDGDGESETGKEVADEDEVEYIDEDKFTTVTIGPMDLSDGDDVGENGSGDGNEAGKSKKRAWTHEKPKGIEKKRPKKPKKKAFRYEAPAERKAARSKQKARNSTAARERKGSKSGRR